MSTLTLIEADGSLIHSMSGFSRQMQQGREFVLFCLASTVAQPYLTAAAAGGPRKTTWVDGRVVKGGRL